MSTGMIVEIVLAIVLAVLLVLLLLVLRRVQQLRRGGVDVAARPLREPAGSSVDDLRGWHTGIGRYRGDQFRWYRVGGLSSAPTLVLDRTEVEIVDRREPRSGELSEPGTTVLLVRMRSGSWELAMAPGVLTGFSSWLESTPPGRSTGYRQAS